jgi:hypothetical protein
MRKASTTELIEAGLFNPEALIDPGPIDAKIADMIAPGGYERWIAKSKGKKIEHISEANRMRMLLGLKIKK